MRRYFKRIYIRFLLWWRRKSSRPVKYDNEFQEETCKFVEKVIRDKNSKFIIVPKSGTHRIQNEEFDCHIKLSSNYINITKTKYSVDIKIYERIFEGLEDKINRRLSQEKDKFKKDVREKQVNIIKYLNKKVDE